MPDTSPADTSPVDMPPVDTSLVDPPPALAEQARGVRWWLKAVLHSPLLCVLLLVQWVVDPVLWAIWHPNPLVRTLAFAVISLPITALFRQLRRREARALEQADEAAECTGRRRPLSAPAAETNPATFSWRSPTGRRLTLMAVIWAGLIAALVWVIAMIVHDDPPQTTETVVLATVCSSFVVLLMLTMAIAIVGGIYRGIQRILADPAERAIVEVIGIDPRNQVWVLQRFGTRSRVTVKLLAGKKLLVAGDTLLAQGAITKPAKNWRRSVMPMMAITGEFGTLWAQHIDAPETPLSGTTISGAWPRPG